MTAAEITALRQRPRETWTDAEYEAHIAQIRAEVGFYDLERRPLVLELPPRERVGL